PVTRAWLVEPHQALADQLARRFPPPKFSAHWLALAEQPGELELEQSSPDDPTASVLPMKAHLSELSHLGLARRYKGRGPADTLDRFAEQAGVDRVDLLKVDTQGSELQVFRGGSKVLQRTRAIWVELSFKQLYAGACLVHEVIEYLAAHQFCLRDVAPE